MAAETKMDAVMNLAKVLKSLGYTGKVVPEGRTAEHTEPTTIPSRNARCVEITIKSWLARERGVSMNLEGDIISETSKAYKFSGNSMVKEAITCLCCGRELTHPVSRLVGYGPICCERFGVHRPDFDNLSDVELDVLKENIRKVRITDMWIPKSQILELKDVNPTSTVETR